MNYLAHLYFADPTPVSRVGNLMGDFYRGRISDNLDDELAAGIRLHRAIDVYTDTHPRLALSRGRLVGPCRRFAGIILDVAFDHFLWRHWSLFHPQPVDQFLDQVYRDLEAYDGYMPERMVVPYQSLCAKRWLSAYATTDGTARALARMAQRLSRPTPLAQGGDVIERHYQELEADFLAYFPALVRYVATHHRRNPQHDP